MRSFIVRPFGTKNDIDFDRVERELIAPALARRRLTGTTTGEILRQGNIREDMFQRLVTADVVIADVSIHNANVFYELGMRHALQDKHTILIRCRADQVPFDIKTDRYLSYDANDPAASLDALTTVIRDTINDGRKDSPVFQLLPRMKPQDPSAFVAVPREFREEVERAADEGDLGDLALLSEELTRFGFEWSRKGLRLVAEAQYRLKAWPSAERTWRAILADEPDDVQANLRLGTVYQKLGRLDASDQALDRVEEQGALTGAQRAELASLRGSNEKSHWLNEWDDEWGPKMREVALESAHLEQSLMEYERGFLEDLNAYYPGVNALALTTIRCELAKLLPGVWAGQFESDEEADLQRLALERRRDRLSDVVEMAIERARGENDPWVAISEADLACLTSKRPSRVAMLYRRAFVDPERQELDACRRQLDLYQRLGVLEANTEAALEVVNEELAKLGAEPGDEDVERVLVFTGHRIDAPDREKPRFPNRAKSEAMARALIREFVEEQIGEVGAKRAVGYSGAANGGDILFHEVCEELGVPSRVYLAGPRDGYVQASVQGAGSEWVQRFDRLGERHETRVLHPVLELPRWLQAVKGYNVWQRNNRWKLHHAMAHGPGRVVLVALWDGGAGDGAGGTRNMIESAETMGAATRILDAKRLLDD